MPASQQCLVARARPGEARSTLPSRDGGVLDGTYLVLRANQTMREGEEAVIGEELGARGEVIGR